MGNSKQRNSAFELLRIVAIVLIIISHYAFHGARSDLDILPQNLIISCNITLGNIGVAIFMMISGFFLRKSEKINITHAIKLLLEYYFYIFLSYGLSFAFLPDKSFDSMEFLKVIFAPFYEQSWFVPAYLLVYLFHPFINKLFTEENYKACLIFIILITVVWSVIPTLTSAPFYLNAFISVFCFYCYGAFLKLSFDIKKNWYNKKTSWMLFLIGLGGITLFQITISIIASFQIDKASMIDWFISRHSILMIIIVAGLIMLVSLSEPFYCKPINFIAGFTLGIYLIHDNDILRNYYWHTLFRTQDYTNTNLMIPHLLMCLSIIFIGCLIIDIVRKYILEVPLFKVADHFKNKIKQKNTSTNE